MFIVNWNRQGQFFGILLVFFCVQTYIVFPIETMLRDDQFVQFVSFMFLPHGVKTFLALFFGLSAIPAIFLVQFFNGLILGSDVAPSIAFACLAAISLSVPILLLHKIRGDDVFAAPFSLSDNNASAFWAYIALAFVSSLISGVLHEIYIGALQNIDLTAMFLIGDIGGAIVFLLLFLLLAPLLKLIGFHKVR